MEMGHTVGQEAFLDSFIVPATFTDLEQRPSWENFTFNTSDSTPLQGGLRNRREDDKKKPKAYQKILQHFEIHR